MEGCSKEVFGLKDHFPRSRMVGLSRYYWVKASLKGRYFGLNVRWYSLFRLLVPIYELRTDVNHIYGSLSEWFFLRALRRRPIIMTIATSAAPLDSHMYRHVRRFVVHGKGTIEELARWGIDRERVRVIYPGIDLARFSPVPRAPGKPFRVLFATAPNHPDGLVARGVNLILDAAAYLPDVEFQLQWRPWGETRPIVERALAEKRLNNVTVSAGLVRDMTEVFHAADATIAPFLQSHDMKLCPTSLIESLACGKPVLVSTKVGIADLIQEEACGEVFEPTVEGLCVAIERLRGRYMVAARNARPCAERHFDLRQCVHQYEQLYGEVSACLC
jgi:glycosyltransferase involved in cell wall biosynthesis